MRSAWFWGTDMFQQYLVEYAKSRPECLREWKTSPLGGGEDFSECITPSSFGRWKYEDHQSQVLDLRTHTWSDVRKSYRGKINKAKRSYAIELCGAADMVLYKGLHCHANGGQPRPDTTYQYYAEWIRDGFGMLVLARDNGTVCAGAYWALYQKCAYYGSGASVVDDVQHAVIWTSLERLKERGITLVELGQIDGSTEKEQGIALFKKGFGGQSMPYTVVRRSVHGT